MTDKISIRKTALFCSFCGKKLKKYEYDTDIQQPYKIFNLAAHFEDIVEGELKSSDVGYRIAGSDGLGGGVMPKKNMEE